MGNNPISNIDPNGDNPLLIGAAIGFLSNGIQNVASGNNFFQGGLKAAFIGAWGGGVSAGIGQAFGNVSGFGNELLRAGAHGASGGLQSMAGGGSFGSGFLSGGISSGVGSGIGALGGGATAQWAGGGLSGGLGSVIGGGNFFEGAGMGLMVGGLNHAAHSLFDPPWLRKLKQAYKEFWESLGFGDDIPTYTDTKMALKDTEAKAQKILDGQLTAMSLMFGGNPISMGGLRGMGRYFASLEQLASTGTVMARGGAIKDLPRLIAMYGGEASDWTKVVSTTYKGRDGFKFSAHWYERAGRRIEIKTVIGR